MHIYLTGATGYLGMNLLNAFIRSEDVGEIRLLVRDKRKLKDLLEIIDRNNEDIGKELLKDKINFQIGSLPNIKLDLNGIDFIIHAASLRGSAIKGSGYKEAVDVNIFGTRQAVYSIKKHKCQKTIFISSQSVYFNNPNLPWKESARPAPADIYSATKYAGELLIKDLEKYGLSYTILRPSRFYGLGLGMRENELLVKFARAIINKQSLTIYNNGNDIMDFLHIKDMVNFILTLLRKKQKKVWNQVYNIASGKSISIAEIVNHFEAAADKLNLGQVLKHYINNESFLSPIVWSLDTTKAKNLIGWNHSTLLEEGIEEIILHELVK